MNLIHLEVITPAKAAYKGEVQSLTVPGSMGSFQILYNHAAIISSLDVGIVKIREQKDNLLEFSIGGGTVEVLNNSVLLLAESFERPEEIDIERAQRSLERAKERLSLKHKDKIDNVRAESSLHRAVNRLKLVGKYPIKET